MSPALQEAANLVIVAGNRDDVRELEPGARNVWTELLMVIDQYDLYGRVAYPKHHGSADVPAIYFVYALVGAVDVIFHQAEECKRVTGIDPSEPSAALAHARAVEHLFLGASRRTP